MDSIKMQEVEVIEQTRIWKATEEENIVTELIKYGGYMVKQWIRGLFKEARKDENIPKDRERNMNMSIHRNGYNQMLKLQSHIPCTSNNKTVFKN
jgi:hypothetical protein